MTTDMIFESLTEGQKGKVKGAFGTRELMCSGCGLYLGKTELGEHTYFWHCGAGEGYVSLPVGHEPEEGYWHVTLDYESGSIRINTPESNREFTTEGVEILPPPFQYLVHVDLRRWDPTYKEKVEREGPFTDPQQEESFLICCGGGCYLPERAAKAAGVKEGTAVPWVVNYWLAPWELTEELFQACVAVTAVYPDGRRVAIM